VIEQELEVELGQAEVIPREAPTVRHWTGRRERKRAMSFEEFRWRKRRVRGKHRERNRRTVSTGADTAGTAQPSARAAAFAVVLGLVFGTGRVVTRASLFDVTLSTRLQTKGKSDAVSEGRWWALPQRREEGQTDLQTTPAEANEHC
jgi:hypothetical protein